jgi:pilus assembly protein CpaE
VNRFVDSKPLTLDVVEKTLGIKAFWTLPNDYPAAVSAVNQGVPIHDVNPRSKLAKSYHGLAEALLQTLSSADGRRAVVKVKKPSLLRRLMPLRSAAQ